MKGSKVIVAILMLLVPAAWAQEVGTVAAFDGTAEIGRGGAWTAAAIGGAVQQGDELRTGKPGRLRIVFQDDSVLALSDDSHVVVNEQVFDPSAGNTNSLMGLLRGKVNAIVSDYYHHAGAAYEIKTKTAVAGVRGTEFSMKYDPRDEVTEVVGITGVVSVHSVLDPSGPGVLITANETTTIAEGQLPTAPRRMNETIFRQQLQGIDFIGGGRAESLSASHPIVAGAAVPVPDRAPVGAPVGPNVGGGRDASTLVGESPDVVKTMTGQLGINLGHK